MNRNNVERMQEILSVLAECQLECASITMKIGGTTASGMVEHDVIYIQDAPEMVMNTLVSKGYHLRPTPQGLRVACDR